MSPTRTSRANPRSPAQLLRGVVLVAGAGCASSPPPSYVEPMTSQMPRVDGIVVQPRMRRHADQLAELRNAVFDVDFARAGAVARIILAEPRLTRPAPPGDHPTGDDPRSARYYTLENRMLAATRDVAAAADACDRAALDHAFDALTATCRACHVLYEERSR